MIHRYKVGSHVLSIPQKTKTQAIGTVVPWHDVAETCRCLRSLLLYLKDTQPQQVVDGVAGSGFWAALVQQQWPNVRLLLNETCDDSVLLLKKFYPTAQVTQQDLHQWQPPSADLGILEFHQFTLRIWEKYQQILDTWSQKMERIILADGACFGFKFGNLCHYGLDKEWDYYELLNETLRPVLHGKQITMVSKFTNAALMVIEYKPKQKKIIPLPPTTFPLFRDGKAHPQPSYVKQGNLWTGIK